MRRVEGRQASMRRVRARACAVEGHWSECGVCDKGIGGECGWADVLEQARRYNLARGAGRVEVARTCWRARRREPWQAVQ